MSRVCKYDKNFQKKAYSVLLCYYHRYIRFCLQFNNLMLVKMSDTILLLLDILLLYFGLTQGSLKLPK